MAENKDLEDIYYIIIFDDEFEIHFGYKVNGYPKLSDMYKILSFIEESKKENANELHFSVINEIEFEEINEKGLE